MSKLAFGCFWLAGWVFTSGLKRLALSILCGGSWAVSRVEGSARARGLPSGVYLAGGLQWHFACGFDFSGFAVLRGLLMVSVGTMASF